MRATIDAAALPDHAFGSRSIMWWSVMLLIAIETTVFVMAIASYFYLQGNENEWPPAGTLPPALRWGTINTIVMLASLIPNQLTKNAAEKMDLRRVRIWLPVAIAFAVVFTSIRVLEFETLNVKWDSNAYGSITWTLLGFHTFHVVTDLLDSLLLVALMYTHHGNKPKRFVDTAENSAYWYFVVLTWIPIYFVIYWAPRFFGG